MPRARNIKPSFFTNDSLAELDPLTRLLFIGLWTIADREGRLEVRKRRIKVQLLPYDNCDVNAQLCALEDAGFVYTYEIGNKQYLQILKFTKHQYPHKNEAQSTIPAPDLHETNPPESITYNLSTEPIAQMRKTAHRFEEWWKEYPNKKDKKRAMQKWKARKLDAIADTLITDTKNRNEHDAQWKRGYIPLPTTYINGDRWEDEIETDRTKQSGNGQSETAVQRRERRNREAYAAAT